MGSCYQIVILLTSPKQAKMLLQSSFSILTVCLVAASPDGPGGHHHHPHGEHAAHAQHGNQAHAGHHAQPVHAVHNTVHTVHSTNTVHLGGGGAADGGQTIAAIVAGHPKFTTLLSALKAAGLVDALASGSWTVFAPTNAAFDKVPVEALNSLLSNPEELKQVLLRHVVPGTVIQGKNIPPGTTPLKSASGEEISATRDKFIQVTSPAGSAYIVLFDVIATNGVIHAIDTVI